jgi:hypothetical protein
MLGIVCVKSSDYSQTKFRARHNCIVHPFEYIALFMNYLEASCLICLHETFLLIKSKIIAALIHVTRYSRNYVTIVHCA